MRLSVIPEIAAMQREAGEGRCAFCEEVIPSWRLGAMPPVHCGELVCKRFYFRIYNCRRRRLFKEAGLTVHGDPLGSNRPPHVIRTYAPRVPR